ncbi:hypothetical protein BJX68DRAFT_265052 [Aspergillus pseudodeflectus]|uniref:Rhodopsin domain-containing protein n=1 Tax=Aspergillus pseudodeflectus TaxID=176178 RepID=A0ABR4KMU6_9EURO
MTYATEGSVMALGVLFSVLGTAVVVTRLVVQHRRAGAQADDWFVLAAWVFLIALCSLMIAGSATHTFGSHSPPGLGPAIYFYEDAQLRLTRKLQYSFDILSVWALGCLKLSILLSYRRLFSIGRAKLINSALLLVTVVWTVTFTIALIVQCGSHFGSRFRSLQQIEANCANVFEISIALVATDVAVDLIILVIPIFMVFPLQMPLKKRLGVIAILMLGMSATACGIARLGLFAALLGPTLFSSPTVAGFPTHDDTGIVSSHIFWSMLEVGIASIAVSLPVLYSLRRRWSLRGVFEYFQSLVSLTRRSGASDDRHSDQEMITMHHPVGQGLGDNRRGWDVQISRSVTHSLESRDRYGSEIELVTATTAANQV